MNTNNHSDENLVCLSEEMLIYLNEYDEFYSLYETIQSIYKYEYEKLDVIDNRDIKALDNSKGRFIQPLNEFISKNYYIFYNEPERLKLIESDTKSFRFLEKEAEYGKTDRKFRDFSGFLQMLEIIIAIKIKNIDIEISGSQRNISVADEINKIDRRINELVSQSIKSQEKFIKKYNPTAHIYPEKDLPWIIRYENLSCIKCRLCHHNIVKAWVRISLRKRNGEIFLPIHECLDCHSLFVGDITIKAYENHYNEPLPVGENAKSNHYYDDAFLGSSESLLHTLGYKVGIHGLEEEERHRLLIDILKKGKMSYFEIIRTIEQDIMMFQDRDGYGYAIMCWQNDLIFLSEYELHSKDK